MSPPIVLIHGMFHGGWAWGRVRRILQASGREVFTPSLTGMGDRAHLAAPELGLRAHIRDVVQFFESEDIRNAILVGHSLSGSMVITGAAEQLAQRIAGMIYVDGPPATHGWNFWDHWPEAREIARSLVAPNGWQIVPPDPTFWGIVEPALLAWVRQRLVPVAFATCDEPLEAPGGHAARLPHIRIRSKQFTVHDALWDSIAGQPGEGVVAVDAPHELLLTDPGLVASVLHSFSPGGDHDAG